MAVAKGPMGEDAPLIAVAKTRLSALERLRDRLSMEIDVCGDRRTLAQLTRELRATLSEIDSIGPAELVCAADEIERRREERRRRERSAGAPA